MRKALLSFAVIVACCIPIAVASAQQPDVIEQRKTKSGLTITPLRTDPTVKAGDAHVQKITVENRSTAPMDVVLSYEEFRLTDENYEYTFTPADSIITFESPTFTLAAGDKRAVAYRIDIPANYAPGGYYFTIFATNTTTSGSVETQSRVGSLVFMTVDGKLDRTVSIKSLQAPSFSMKRTIPLELRLENTGNVHVTASVETTMSGPATNTQATAAHLIMPGTTRLVPYSLPSPRLPGIYTIKVTANTGYSQPASTTVQVLYIPLWFVLFSIVLLAIIPSIIRRKKHRSTSTKTPPDTESE